MVYRLKKFNMILIFKQGNAKDLCSNFPHKQSDAQGNRISLVSYMVQEMLTFKVDLEKEELLWCDWEHLLNIGMLQIISEV